MVRRVGIVAVLIAVLAAGCGSSSDDGSSATTAKKQEEKAGPPYAVDEVTVDFVDTSRLTAAGVSTPAKPERTLRTRIVFPKQGGPYPLVVLSHGASGHPNEYHEQIPQWAAEGFVIAAPMFPLTNGDIPSSIQNFNDIANQPADVSFVIDEVLAANDEAGSPLRGKVDEDSIGLLGHSLGAATSWAAGYHTAVRDPRVDAVTIFAGMTFPIEGGDYDFADGPPLLVLHGDADDVPMDMDQAAYDQASPPKWFVTLHGAEHRIALTDEPSPYDELVTRTIIDFWRGTLGGDDAALARVTKDATDATLSTVQHEGP